MSDFKSKMPDFKEITAWANKLFKDVKDSVGEIVDDYKTRREQEPPQPKPPVEPKDDVVTSSDKKHSIKPRVKRTVKVETPTVKVEKIVDVNRPDVNGEDVDKKD